MQREPLTPSSKSSFPFTGSDPGTGLGLSKGDIAHRPQDANGYYTDYRGAEYEVKPRRVTLFSLDAWGPRVPSALRSWRACSVAFALA